MDCVDPGLCLTPVPPTRPGPDPYLQAGAPAGLGLSPSPERCPTPGAGAAPVPRGCPAPDWGGGVGTGHRALPGQTPPGQLLMWCKIHVWRKTSGQAPFLTVFPGNKIPYF